MKRALLPIQVPFLVDALAILQNASVQILGSSASAPLNSPDPIVVLIVASPMLPPACASGNLQRVTAICETKEGQAPRLKEFVLG